MSTESTVDTDRIKQIMAETPVAQDADETVEEASAESPGNFFEPKPPAETLSFSPRPPRPAEHLDWAGACKALVAHKIVRRVSWPQLCFVFMDDDRVKIKNPDGTIHILMVSSGDILGEDWVVV